MGGLAQGVHPTLHGGAAHLDEAGYAGQSARLGNQGRDESIGTVQLIGRRGVGGCDAGAVHHDLVLVGCPRQLGQLLLPR